MKASHAVAFTSGVIFALGLGLSGMTQPSKVIAFLDVGGAWDPSLAFVMVGAIGVHFMFARRMKGAPTFSPAFELPRATAVDRRLVAGAALFGVGWGIAGFCPGPAVVSVVALARGLSGAPASGALTFVGAMLVGMLVYARFAAPVRDAEG